MHIIAAIHQPAVTERILRHLGLWANGPCAAPDPPPCNGWHYEPDATADPMRDYENVFAG